MIIILIALTILSALILAVGVAWLLAVGGQVERREGQEVGKEIATGLMQGNEDESAFRKTAFKGKAKAVDYGASYSFREVKELLKSGKWREAAPLLLAVGGLLGLISFGSLTLFLAIDDKLVGGLVAAVALFSVLRVLVGMIRA
jgi:hypothetical protein